MTPERTRDDILSNIAWAIRSSAAHSSSWTDDDINVMAGAAIAAIELSGHCIMPVKATGEIEHAIFMRIGFGSGADDISEIYSAAITAGRT